MAQALTWQAQGPNLDSQYLKKKKPKFYRLNMNVLDSQVRLCDNRDTK